MHTARYLLVAVSMLLLATVPAFGHASGSPVTAAASAASANVAAAVSSPHTAVSPSASTPLTAILVARRMQPVSRTRAQAKLVWADEFNGPLGSAPSAANWYVDSGKSSCGVETDDPGAVSIDGAGHLVITARSRNGGYVSGKLQTNPAWKYGTIEARIEIPAGRGLWPAFWGLGADFDTVGWPACGEIDAMESLGNDTHTVYGSVHGKAIDRTTPVTVPPDLSAGFHTYGVTWTATSVTMFVDGAHYATYAVKFRRPFFWILDLAVGAPGAWPGGPGPATQFPATMQVDWVRVYR